MFGPKEEGYLLFIEERHQSILELLKANGRISIGEIQERFDVSVDSARRDLRILEEKGLLKRTHGGAIPIKQVGFGKPPKITPRDITEIKENYFAIAMKAVSLIRENDAIFLTSATVGYFMAQNLPKDIRLTVVTNSIIIAEELRKYDNITGIMVGGEMDDRGTCYDTFATDFIKSLRFDISFVTAASISAEFGVSIQKSKGVGFLKAVIGSSKCSVGLFPTEKIGFESTIKICSADRLHKLITDWDAPEEELSKFEELGVEVIVVEKESQ